MEEVLHGKISLLKQWYMQRQCLKRPGLDERLLHGWPLPGLCLSPPSSHCSPHALHCSLGLSEGYPLSSSPPASTEPTQSKSDMSVIIIACWKQGMWGTLLFIARVSHSANSFLTSHKSVTGWAPVSLWHQATSACQSQTLRTPWWENRVIAIELGMVCGPMVQIIGDKTTLSFLLNFFSLKKVRGWWTAKAKCSQIKEKEGDAIRVMHSGI